MSDGAKDDMVWDHRLCHFDDATLKCPAADGPDCPTGPELRTVQAILDGPRGADGKLIAQLMPITNMSLGATFTGAVVSGRPAPRCFCGTGELARKGSSAAARHRASGS
jgi:hypothetical protein